MATCVQAFKGYLQPKIFLFFFLGLSCGIPYALIGGTLSLWLTRKNFGLEEIGVLSFMLIPYSIKFIWAPFIDRFRLPIFSRSLGQKKAWGFFFQIGLLLSLICFTFVVHRSAYVTPVFYVLGLLTSFFASGQDIVVDALRIDTLDKEELGEGAGTYQFGYRIGMLCAGAGVTAIAPIISWENGYLILTCFIILGMISLFFIRETQDKNEHQSYNEVVTKAIYSFVKMKHWIPVFLFIILYKMCNAVLGKMAGPFYLLNGFSEGQIALVSGIFGSWVTMVGIPLGGVLVMRFGLLKSLFGLGLIEVMTSIAFAVLAYLGNNLTAFFVVIAFDNIVGGMGTAVFVAYLSSLCIKEYSASQYALLSALMMISSSVFSAFSGYLAHHLGWVNFFLMTGILMMPSLFILKNLIRYEKEEKNLSSIK